MQSPTTEGTEEEIQNEQSPTTERTEEEIKNEQCNHQLQREPKRKSRMNNAITNYRENRRGNKE